MTWTEARLARCSGLSYLLKNDPTGYIEHRYLKINNTTFLSILSVAALLLLAEANLWYCTKYSTMPVLPAARYLLCR